MGQTGIYLLKHVHKVNSSLLWHHKGLLQRLLKARQNTNPNKMASCVRENKSNNCLIQFLIKYTQRQLSQQQQQQRQRQRQQDFDALEGYEHGGDCGGFGVSRNGDSSREEESGRSAGNSWKEEELERGKGGGGRRMGTEEAGNTKRLEKAINRSRKALKRSGEQKEEAEKETRKREKQAKKKAKKRAKEDIGQDRKEQTDECKGVVNRSDEEREKGGGVEEKREEEEGSGHMEKEEGGDGGAEETEGSEGVEQEMEKKGSEEGSEKEESESDGVEEGASEEEGGVLAFLNREDVDLELKLLEMVKLYRDLQEEGSHQPDWEVKKVLYSRVDAGTRFYMVRWKDTWVSKEETSQMRSTVEKFKVGSSFAVKLLLL